MSEQTITEAVLAAYAEGKAAGLAQGEKERQEEIAWMAERLDEITQALGDQVEVDKKYLDFDRAIIYRASVKISDQLFQRRTQLTERESFRHVAGVLHRAIAECLIKNVRGETFERPRRRPPMIETYGYER